MTRDAADLLGEVERTLQGVRERLADLLVLCPPTVADEVPPVGELVADAGPPPPLQLPGDVAAPSVVLPQEAGAQQAVAQEEPVR